MTSNSIQICISYAPNLHGKRIKGKMVGFTWQPSRFNQICINCTPNL